MSSGIGASGADGGSGATGDPRPTRVPLYRGVSAGVAGPVRGSFSPGPAGAPAPGCRRSPIRITVPPDVHEVAVVEQPIQKSLAAAITSSRGGSGIAPHSSNPYSGSAPWTVPLVTGRFEPQLVERVGPSASGVRPAKVISPYARGMTTREIRAHVEELYGVKVSRQLISKVTDERGVEWRSPRCSDRVARCG